MQSPTASQYPDLYRDLGIDTGNLGCIMAKTEPITVSDVIDAEDLYYSADQEFVQGIVSELKSHVTLLYGLMHSGLAMQKHVDTVLDGWSLNKVQINNVAVFSSEDNPYACLVATLVPSEELNDANARLRLLPHIDSFPSYKPHITLAYVNNDPEKVASYMDQLSRRLALREVSVTGIDYGG